VYRLAWASSRVAGPAQAIPGATEPFSGTSVCRE
jgi:hypothetical protein